MIKLHLGCGDNYLGGWVNIDLESKKADKRLDLTKDLPYTSGIVTCIYAEHFIEHIKYNELQGLLKECYRVLVPSGVIRVSTPDLCHLIGCYFNGQIGEWRKEYKWAPESPCRMVNEAFTLWGHKYVYDEPELFHLLEIAGFTEIKRCLWKDSGYIDFYNIESRPYHGDLIMEGTKHE